MANPNIVNVSSILGITETFALTTTLTTTLITAASDKVYKINSILVSNIDGTSAAGVTIAYDDQTNTRTLASTISVPADATLSVVDKNNGFYLTEGDSIEGGASANGDLVATISYEILDDA